MECGAQEIVRGEIKATDHASRGLHQLVRAKTFQFRSIESGAQPGEDTQGEQIILLRRLSYERVEWAAVSIMQSHGPDLRDLEFIAGHASSIVAILVENFRVRSQIILLGRKQCTRAV